MSLDVSVFKKPDHLVVHVSGVYELNEAISRFPHVLTACQITGISKVIIDYRELEGIPAATQKLIYAFDIREQYDRFVSTTGMELTVAYLGSAPAVSTYEPGFEMAEAEGYSFAQFTDLKEAQEWLGVPAT